MQLMTLSKSGAAPTDTALGAIAPDAQTKREPQSVREGASFAEVLGESAAQLPTDSEELAAPSAPEAGPEIGKKAGPDAGDADHDVESDPVETAIAPTPDDTSSISPLSGETRALSPQPQDPILLAGAPQALPLSGAANPAEPRSDLPSALPSQQQGQPSTRPLQPHIENGIVTPGPTANQTWPGAKDSADTAGSIRPDAAMPLQGVPSAPQPAYSDASRQTTLEPPAASVLANPAPVTRSAPAETHVGDPQNTTPKLFSQPSPVRPAGPVQSPLQASETAPIQTIQGQTDPRVPVPKAAPITEQSRTEPLKAAMPLLATDQASRRMAPQREPTGPSARIDGQATPAPAPPAQATFSSVSLSSGQTTVPPGSIPADPAGDELVQVGELRLSSEPGTTLQRANPNAALVRPETPRHVAAQIAEAIQRGGANRAIDLTLNPVELGRVKISLQPSEGVMLVHVIADRGETLDLMRRHAEVLAQELHSIGFGEAQFSFSHHSSGENDARETNDQAEGGERPPASPGQGIRPSSTPNVTGLTLSDRVDIRV